MNQVDAGILENKVLGEDYAKLYVKFMKLGWILGHDTVKIICRDFGVVKDCDKLCSEFWEIANDKSLKNKKVKNAKLISKWMEMIVCVTDKNGKTLPYNSTWWGYEEGGHWVEGQMERLYGKVANEMYAISYDDNILNDLVENAMDWITDKDLYSKIQDLHQKWVDTVNGDFYSFQEQARYGYYVLKLTEIIFETIESQIDEELTI